MNWIILIVAGLCEVGFTYCLGRAKSVAGLEWWLWIGGFLFFSVVSMTLLAKATQTWLFRSGHQDSNPDTENKTVMLEVTPQNGYFTYTALYMGWKFSKQIKLAYIDEKIIIEDISM